MNNVIDLSAVREERYYSNLELCKLKSKQLEEQQIILSLAREIYILKESIKTREKVIDNWSK